MRLLQVFTDPEGFEISKESIYNALRNNKIFKSLLLSLKNHKNAISLPEKNCDETFDSDASTNEVDTCDKIDKFRVQVLELISKFTEFPAFLDGDDFDNLIYAILSSDCFASQICYIPHYLKLVKRASQEKAISSLIKASLKLIFIENMRGFSMLYSYFKLKKSLNGLDESSQREPNCVTPHPSCDNGMTIKGQLSLVCYPAIDVVIETAVRQINNRITKYFDLKLRNLRLKYATEGSEDIVGNLSNVNLESNSFYSPPFQKQEMVLRNFLQSDFEEEYILKSNPAINHQNSQSFLEKWTIKGQSFQYFRERIDVDIEKETLVPKKLDKKEETLRKKLNFPSLVLHGAFMSLQKNFESHHLDKKYLTKVWSSEKAASDNIITIASKMRAAIIGERSSQRPFRQLLKKICKCKGQCYQNSAGSIKHADVELKLSSFSSNLNVGDPHVPSSTSLKHGSIVFATVVKSINFESSEKIKYVSVRRKSDNQTIVRVYLKRLSSSNSK